MGRRVKGLCLFYSKSAGAGEKKEKKREDRMRRNVCLAASGPQKLPRGLLLHLELGIDDVVLALAVAAGRSLTAGLSPGLALHELGHRLGRGLEVLDAL